MARVVSKPMTSKNENALKGVETRSKKAKEKRGTLPHYGLYNQGATCDLNSVLQVLFMTTEIHDRFDSQFRKDLQLRKIFERLKKTTCGTENITTTFGINVHEQRDAAECLKMILHHISPQASEVFRGQLMDTKKCSKGHVISVKINEFWTLPLSLTDTPDTTYSVQNNFERNFQMNTYTGDNKSYCSECNKKTEATIESEMVKSPQILILLLTRFEIDNNTRSQHKSNCCVEVPCELPLKNKTYKLYGVVDHRGSIKEGRYTATVLSDEDNTWYECNDERVSKVEEQPFAKAGTFCSKTVYLLMYRALQVPLCGLCDQGDTNEFNLLSLNDTDDTTYSEESSFERIDNTKSFPGNNKVHCDKKMNATSSSAKKMITEHKVELIDCLMPDHSLILQHAHAKQIINDSQYLNIKKRSHSSPQGTVIDLIDDVIFNGQESCTLFLEVLKLPDVLSTYPQLKEIMKKMQLSSSGSNA